MVYSTEVAKTRSRKIALTGKQPAKAAPAARPVAIICHPLYTVGVLVALLGIGLWLGNLSGWLPTFRGSGLLAIAAGCLLWHLGVWFPLRREL